MRRSSKLAAPANRALVQQLRSQVDYAYVMMQEEAFPFGDTLESAANEIERLNMQIDLIRTDAPSYTEDDVTRVAAKMCALTFKLDVADAMDLFEPVDRSKQTRQNKKMNDHLESFQREQRRMAQAALEALGYKRKTAA